MSSRAATAPPAATAPATRRLLVVLAAAIALALPSQAAATGVKPRVSLPAIERQAMCVTCKVALNESQSPQANLEREYIRSLINQGETEAEIKRALVAQYGPTVLGMPGAHGFDLAVYLVPLAVVLGLLATLLLLIPSWRRRARAQGAATSSAAALDPGDIARLESDLARFD